MVNMWFKKCDNRNRIFIDSVLSPSLPAVLLFVWNIHGDFIQLVGWNRISQDFVKSYAVQNINVALNQWWLVASDRTETL
jgi:hypothetical protein